MVEDKLTEQSPLRFETPVYERCYAYWLRLKGDRWAPAWREWDWSEISMELIPFFIVVDVTYDPLQFVYRFWGTANTRMHGIDMTRKSTAEIRSPATALATFDQYARVTESRQAVGEPYTMQSADYNNPHTRLALRMPMSNDGKRVDQIVSFVDWRDSEHLIRDDFIRVYGE